MKIKTIFEFEEEFDSIRDLISPKTLFNVDDNLNAMHEIKRKLLHRIDYLVEKVCYYFFTKKLGWQIENMPIWMLPSILFCHRFLIELVSIYHPISCV